MMSLNLGALLITASLAVQPAPASFALTKAARAATLSQAPSSPERGAAIRAIG